METWVRVSFGGVLRELRYTHHRTYTHLVKSFEVYNYLSGSCTPPTHPPQSCKDGPGREPHHLERR